MIAFPADLLHKVVAAAEAAYPQECCGLLVGHDRKAGTSDILVTRVEASPNVAEGDRARSFEIDPKLRLDLMRTLRGGPDRVVGLFHSHPDHPAQPSERDLAMAWEPELIWVIVSVRDGRAVATTAHRIDEAHRRFAEITIETLARRAGSSPGATA